VCFSRVRRLRPVPLIFIVFVVDARETKLLASLLLPDFIDLAIAGTGQWMRICMYFCADQYALHYGPDWNSCFY
jgi:hypothetical protein